jgi:hypothetical protein
MTRHRDDGSNRNVVTGALKYFFREEQQASLVAGANPAAAGKLKGQNKSLKTLALGPRAVS